jgi:hypothetical protein
MVDEIAEDVDFPLFQRPFHTYLHPRDHLNPDGSAFFQGFFYPTDIIVVRYT